MFLTLSNRQKRKYQVVGVITGGVGTGKSRSLLLNINDFWYKELLKIVPPKKSINTDIAYYIASLNKAQPYELICLDEAIDAFGKGVSNKRMLTALDNMFSICRERSVASIIVLDNIFRLTTSMTRHITYWVHAEKRNDNICKKCDMFFVGFHCPHCGSKKYIEGNVVYRFYSQKKLQEILMFNESKQIKKITNCNVLPNFRSSIKEYKGELLNYYNKLKDDKTTVVMNALKKEFSIPKGDSSI